MSSPNRRSYYRLQYLDSNSPTFRMNGIDFKVLDLSEEGLRFQNVVSAGISFNDPLAGTLNFQDGQTFLIRGEIIRLTDKDVTLKLKTPIPLRKIVEEQRDLLNRFPKTKVS